MNSYAAVTIRFQADQFFSGFRYNNRLWRADFTISGLEIDRQNIGRSQAHKRFKMFVHHLLVACTTQLFVIPLRNMEMYSPVGVVSTTSRP